MDKLTLEKVIAFRDERDWKQFHNPKDLAISISLEAAELLELFQWKREDDKVDIERIREELADVLMYSISLADILNLDLDDIILSKLEKNGNKYPVALSKGSAEKYNKLRKG